MRNFFNLLLTFCFIVVFGQSEIPLKFQEYGPGNRGGRTRAFIIDKYDANKLYAGAIGGGIWISYNGGYSWYKKSEGLTNYVISTLYQADQNTLYAGTGEYFGITGGLSYKGNGIFKSTNGGESWFQLPSTNNDDFAYVIKINGYGNKIYAGTYKGLKVSTDGGETWEYVLPNDDPNYDKPCTDIEISPDGSLVAVVINNLVYISNDGGVNFEKKSSNNQDHIPDTDILRLELAIAPSNPNYIYCLAVNEKGTFKNIYYSNDKGQTWKKIYQNVTLQFQPFGTEKNKQGFYHCSLAVLPTDENTIFIGGVDLYKYNFYSDVAQISVSDLSEYSPKYIHKNIHNIVFSPNYVLDNTIYVTTDGGIFKSTNEGNSWININKKYQTGAFLSVGISKNKEFIGGTFNSGLLYNDLMGSNITDFKRIYFDSIVGFVERSNINPNFMLVTTKYGSLYRTANGYLFYPPSTFFITNSKSGQKVGTRYEPFLTPVRIYENFYDTASIQYVEYKALKNYNAGDTIAVATYLETFIYHILERNLPKDSSIFVKNTYQILTAIGLHNSVWISWEALDPSKTNTTDSVEWFQIVKDAQLGKVLTLEFSADGNILFFGGYDSINNKSVVCVAKNLQRARTSSLATYNSPDRVVEVSKLGTFDGQITSIAVNPYDPNKILITFSNKNGCKIYYSENALETTSELAEDNFTEKQGNIDLNFDVYSSLLPWKKEGQNNEALVGTSCGLFFTYDINNPNWIKINELENTIVTQIRQQLKPNGWLHIPEIINNGLQTGIETQGVIFVSTHGRGIFMSDDYKGPINVKENFINNDLFALIFPNPASSYFVLKCFINESSPLNVSVYTLEGKKVRNFNVPILTPGEKTLTFPINELNNGMYIVKITNNKTSISKLLLVN